MAGYLKRLFQNLLLGLAGSLERSAPAASSEKSPVRREWEDLEHSQADYRVRRIGSVRYSYSGPVIGLDGGGILERTRTWKTVTDRDLRNRCTEGTGITEDE